MSKFFDETQRAQDWALREGAAKNMDIQNALENVKQTVNQADVVVNQMTDARLNQCRKIHLARPAGSPVLMTGGDQVDAVADSYRALRTRLMRAQSANGLRSVVISSTLKGEGKTLTAMNLSLSCAQLQDTRILLVDSDLRTRGLTHLIGFPAAPGLAEVLAGKAQFQEAILATDLPNLFILAAGTPPAAPAELYAGDRWRELIGWCAESFKLILVDSPPIMPLTDFDLITSACDGVLVVVRALRTQRELLQKAADQVDKQKLLGAVFNAASLNGTGAYYYYGYGYGSNGQK